MKIIGIDLAGSQMRDSGFCVLENRKADVCILHTDKEIIEMIKAVKPRLVAIDAPLSLPKGRKSIDQKNDIHFRECDLELRRLGIRFCPITLGPMRMLTRRGMQLKQEIAEFSSKIEVIEVYPGATYDTLKTGRKDKGAILELFRSQGVKLDQRNFSQDELDAITCALTGRMFLKKNAFPIGSPSEGSIIIPKPY